MTDTPVFCNQCGQQSAAGATFCTRCGASLGPTGASAIPQMQRPTAYVGYGGFWIRFLAALIDGIILWVVFMPFNLMFGVGMFGTHHSRMGPENLAALAAMGSLLALLKLLAGWFYEAYFTSSERQATPGKMALGLKVTDLQGRRISFANATGRYFAKWVSAIILMIGFIMAAFTERKQALHDMIASTLVVKS